MQVLYALITHVKFCVYWILFTIRWCPAWCADFTISFKQIYWVNVIGLILRLTKYVNLKGQNLATKIGYNLKQQPYSIK